MDKKSKILVWIFLIAVFISASVTFYRYMVIRDFDIVDSGKSSVTN